jgi:hypothetical protein
VPSVVTASSGFDARRCDAVAGFADLPLRGVPIDK